MQIRRTSAFRVRVRASLTRGYPAASGRQALAASPPSALALRAAKWILRGSKKIGAPSARHPSLTSERIEEVTVLVKFPRSRARLAAGQATGCNRLGGTAHKGRSARSGRGAALSRGNKSVISCDHTVCIAELLDMPGAQKQSLIAQLTDYGG